MATLRLRQLTSIGEIRAIAPAWDRLWERSEVAMPTARAELVAQWLEHFAPTATLCVLVVEHGDELAAALPLAAKRRQGLLAAGDLTWNCWSPNGEFLLDPSADAPAVLGILAEAVQGAPWPLLWLAFVSLESRRWQSLLGAFDRLGLWTNARPHYRIGQVELAGRFANYEAGRSANLRRSLRKDLRRLERDGPVELRLWRQFAAGEVEQRLRRAFEIEHRSWKRDGGQTVLDTPGMLEFYCRQARQLAEWGSLQIAFLEHRGRPIAYEVGWVAKGVYHSFKVSYDADYRAFGPGHLLRWRLIEALFDQRDVQVVDYQGPLTEALASWATRSYAIGRLLVTPPRLAGRALAAGYRTLAPVVRRLRGLA